MRACIVGGGTAGWITLSYLAATTDLELTILHSNEIDIIGVGESTTPAVNHVAKTCGIDETKFMRDSNATYKYAINFKDWHTIGSQWLHTFDNTRYLEGGLNSLELFLRLRELDPSLYDLLMFNKTHGPFEYLRERRLSLYDSSGQLNQGNFPGTAYHINAHKFSQALRENTHKERFTEMVATVSNVNHDEAGISNLVLSDGSEITADIYFDCTGFHRLLSKGLTDFHPYKDMRNNRAIFGNVKGLTLDDPVTGAIAKGSGWIWNIPTWGQVGSGHVYCDSYMSETEAEEVIVNHWKELGHVWTPSRHVKFESGRLENIAIKNLITNGLGQSFIEPLEATSVMTTCVTVIEFSKQYNKHDTWNERSSSVLDKVISKMLEDTKDYVRYHYELSDRTDTDYWNDVRNPKAEQEVSDWIDRTKDKSLYLNGFNWLSMLLGYNKRYTNSTIKFSDKELEYYQNYNFDLENHYKMLMENNQTVKDRLSFING